MSDGDGAAGGRVVCAGCGCVCDDLRLDGPPFERGRPNVETDCPRGRRWFARRVFGGALSAGRPAVDGEPAGLADAAARAAALLHDAVHPRVTGLERLPLGAQRKLVEVADRVGADVDTERSPERLGRVLAVQRDGGPFVTLGEIRDRADCVVLWFVRPDRTHPRLLERFCPDPSDRADDGGPDERTLVAVGPDAAALPADAAFEVEPRRAVELLWLLRLLVDDADAPERERHPLGEDAARLLALVRAAGCGAWVFGRSTLDPPDPLETAGLLRLLVRLNDEAPWGGRPLRGEGNPAGAEAVLAWQSGYPAAVSYRSGRPAYSGGLEAGGDARSTGAAHDVVLLAGGDPSSLPRDARCVWLDTGGGGGSLDDDGADAASGRDGASGRDRDRPSGGSGGDDPATREGGDGERRTPAVRLPVLPPGAAEGDTLLRMDGLPVRSPGLPDADGWDGTHAEHALDAVLREITDLQREEAAR